MAVLGEAQELNDAGTIIQESCGDPQVCQLQTGELDFPAHLQSLYGRSASLLSSEEQAQLKQLLAKYAHVFARDEFDLGNFQALEHPIDTGTANPVKQKMRRTPLSFAGEEKAHLERMLEEKVEFLGREVSANRIELREEHIKAVQSWPVPRSTKQVEQFLGRVNYHRSFIKNFAAIAVPLYHITGKWEFQWNAEQEEAFEVLKQRLVEAPVLAMPNSHDLFILDTDVSNDAMGAELLQLQEGEEKVIAYGSSALSPEQRRYCVTRWELLAVVKFTRQYRHYLRGRKFTVRTDYSSLRWLLNFRYPQGQLARWLEELSQYDMDIQHRPGRRHGNADALSRRGIDSSYCEGYKHGVDLEDLPCKGCKYCTTAHSNWAQFEDEVDYVVPLTVKPKAQLVKAATEDSIHVNVVHAVLDDFGRDLQCSQGHLEEIAVARVGDGGAGDVPHERVRAEQEGDPHLAHLLEWLKEGTTPNEATTMLWSPAEKYLWINRDVFRKIDGLLYFHKDGRDRLVVPRSLVRDVLQSIHDLPSVGHAGRDRTKALVKERYFWCGLGHDVAEYVASCKTCNQSKKSSSEDNALPPSANGQVERYNRALMNAVRCYVGKTHNKWDEFLSQIAGALRATVNRSTGFTANMLMLGREVNLPSALMYPAPRKQPPIDLGEYSMSLVDSMSKAHKAARETLRSTQRRMKRDYDVRSHRRQFSEGDLVYILDSAKIKGVCKKLSSPWKGPARIRQRLSPDLYRVELRNIVSTRHHDRLKPCRDRDIPAWCRKDSHPREDALYCICHGPDNGAFMIQCDYCAEWYHGSCVGVTPQEGEAMNKYKCPPCQQRN
ncbi:uncharacterized protein [Diadema setosum]|uniref:uncharacterized protein n=1 Tax=Diadema setosum TaxID=31175 RepID=UPI003B3B1075